MGANTGYNTERSQNVETKTDAKTELITRKEAKMVKQTRIPNTGEAKCGNKYGTKYMGIKQRVQKHGTDNTKPITQNRQHRGNKHGEGNTEKAIRVRHGGNKHMYNDGGNKHGYNTEETNT